jgi:chromosomal replication initiator protein
VSNLLENANVRIQGCFTARMGNLSAPLHRSAVSGSEQTREPGDPLSHAYPDEPGQRRESGLNQMILPGVVSRDRPGLEEKRFTFDHFVVGPSNRFAYEAGWAVANDGRGAYSPLYLYGESGLGKSHLSGAIGNHIHGRKPTTQILYTTAEEFVNEMVSGIRKKEMAAFKEKYRRRCDILFIDGVHFLSGKEKTQAELSHTLDHLSNFGKQIVLTALDPPYELPHMSDGLRSRLAGGLVVDIQPPDRETRHRILHHKAALEGVTLPEDVLALLASRISGSVRRLEGILINLVAKSSLLGRSIDLHLAQETIQSFQVEETQRVTIDAIQRLVADQYHIQIDQLISRSRRRSICYPRQMAMYLCRRFTSESLDTIGRAFHRDHASVIHSIAVIEKQIREKARVRREVGFLAQKLGMDVSV